MTVLPVVTSSASTVAGSPYAIAAALNTLLQGAGAAVAKRWLVECFLEAAARGLRYGWDGDFVLLGFIPRRIGWAVREGLEDSFGKMTTECARRAGDHFKFKCPVDAEYKISALTGRSAIDVQRPTT